MLKTIFEVGLSATHILCGCKQSTCQPNIMSSIYKTHAYADLN